MISAWLLWFGKCMVAFATAGIAAIVIYGTPSFKDHIESPVAPVVLVFFISYMLAGVVFLVSSPSLSWFFCAVVSHFLFPVSPSPSVV
jgi:hypothetical protein